jgi:uncharacterized membrane protein YcjF (UPF0283 family)
MSNFDNDIRNAVRADTDELARAGDEGLIGQVTATFKSRMRYWVALVWVMSLVMTGLCVFAAIMFFQAETTRDWILYAAIFMWAAVAVAMLKMWYWMEMNRNTHTREIKRVELQIATLAERLDRR